MDGPRREYNLLSCVILSAIGALFGALAISGLVYPLTVFVLSLLPQGDLGAPSEVSAVVCRGSLLAVPLVLAIVGLARWRSPTRSKKQAEQQARLDALLERDGESDGSAG